MVLFSQVKNAADGATWKVASMRGYMFKTNGSDGAFTLTFKNAAGTTYAYSVAANGTITAPATTVPVTGEFLKLLMSTWSQVDPADAAAVLAGTGDW